MMHIAVVNDFISLHHVDDDVSGGRNFREFQGLLAQKFLTQTNAELMEFFDKNDLPVW